MPERWQRELTKIHGARFEADQWERIVAGPRLEAAPAPRPSRLVAATVALAVFAAAAVFAWSAFRPLRTSTPGLGGSNVLNVPARGEVSAAFLANGQPVFVVHRPDGYVNVVSAISPRRVDGIAELVTWCVPTRSFLSWPSASSFSQNGTFDGGTQAPPGLSSFAYEVLQRDDVGDATQIRVGAIAPPLAHHPIPVPPGHVPPCGAGRDIAHTVAPSRIWTSPGRAANASPRTWIAIAGRLSVAANGGIELCANATGPGCQDPATVRDIDSAAVRQGIANGSALAPPRVWLARFTDGVITELVITRVLGPA
jgi:hypothetical protein